MATEVLAGPLGSPRAASTAGGGTALTTTAGIIGLPPGTIWVALSPRNFSTAVVVKFALNPYLIVLKTTDALVAATNLTDASEAVQDQGVLSSTALTMNSFDTAANLNFLYVGSPLPFRGVKVTIGNTNAAGGSALTVKYWNGAWTDIACTDGTDSTDTFRQNGNVTWTVPTDWKRASLFEIGDTVLPSPAFLRQPYFWTRWQTDVAFDSEVTATEMYALNRNTAQYGELQPGQVFEERVHRGPGGLACVEALTDAGTANVIVNVAAGNGGFAV